MLYDPSKRINAPDNRPIITFDTSAINRLADDPDCEALIDGLGVGFHPRLTFTSVRARVTYFLFLALPYHRVPGR